MDALRVLARDHLLELGAKLLGVAFNAATKPLSEIVSRLTRSLLSRLTPTRENDTIIAIEKRHREEDEELERRQRQDDDIEHLQQLQAATKEIEEREEILAREAEDRRVAKEKQKEQEDKIAREIEEREGALAREAEDRRVAKEKQKEQEDKIAREIEERERTLAREAEDRRVAKEKQKEQEDKIAREIEEREGALAREAEDRRVAIEEQKEQEHKIAREIEERERTLAREAEDRRVAKEKQKEQEDKIAREIEERNISEAAQKKEQQRIVEEAEEKQKEQEDKIAREIEEREGTLAREAEDRRVAKEKQKEQEDKIAREIEERNISEAARKKEEQRIVEEAEEQRVAEEARIAENTRLVLIEERMKKWWFAEEARQADEKKEQAERQRQAQEAENQRSIPTETPLATKAARKRNRKMAQKMKRETLAGTARDENRRKIFEEAEERRISAEALEVEEAEERRISAKALEVKEAEERRISAEALEVKEAEERRISAEALEVEEAAKLKDQRIKLAQEMRIVAERVRRGKMIADERSGIQQRITEEPHPAGGISKDELARAKAKLQWSPGQFRFAVSGASGSGKSSLINIFLDLPDNHKAGAQTDVVESTLTVCQYADPGDQPPRKWTVWYDLPGSGTQTIDDVGYFKQQCMYMFDLVLVVFDNRFTKIDLEIIRDCRLEKIPTFIIRSKIDTHIKNHMKSNGYESDDDSEDTKVLRQKSHEHVIAKTRANVESELKKAGLPPQRVYIVSCSKEFRREYAAFISGSVLPASVKGKARFVDEMELIHDLMLAAWARRCDIQPQVAHHTTRAETTDSNALIGRLRTGQMKAMGVRIPCSCKVRKKNVEHIMVECLLTKDTRSQAKRALGVRKLTLIGLLYQETGNPWAVKIWESFMEASKTMREDELE